MEKLIEFKNVTLGYGRRAVLQYLNFSLERGDFLGIVGPNGAGKTTLLRAILGTLKPLAGNIVYHAKRHAVLRFGYVPQRQMVDEAYPLTAFDVVLMGRYGLLGPFRRPRRSDIERSRECLAHVGLDHLSSAPYRDLSGGQKQRVLLARALVADPVVLVLDEPTTDLDLGAEKAIMQLIRHLHDEHSLTVILVSHTLGVVVNYANKIAFLDDSAFQIQDVKQAVTAENLSKLYSIPVEVAEVAGQVVVV
ncbi:MAG TPA: metal ABC transporter ATP-binding protein [Armatimonadota bacterium]|nr:metal ABC transporter ATP-binding protein [Armatimonadota bacterium]